MTTIAENTAVGVMLKAFDQGLKMKAQDGELLVWPDALLSASMCSELSRFKWQLMALLSARFTIGERFDRALFLAEDQHARDALVVAGVESGVIFTRENLEPFYPQPGDSQAEDVF